LSSLASACGGATAGGGRTDDVPGGADAGGAGGSGAGGAHGGSSGGSGDAANAGETQGGTGGALGFSGAGGSHGGALASGGTESSAGSGGTATSTLVTPLCAGGKAFVATGFNPESPADYVGVYLGQAMGAPTLYESTGTLCGGATAVEGCQTAAANLSMQTMGFLPLGSASATSGATRSYAFVLITRADTITAITDEAGLRAFLGPIDTPNEAMLRLFLAGFAPVCTDMIETAEGYELSYRTGMGCGVMDLRVSTSVRRDATVSVTEEMVLTPCLGRRPEGLRGLEPATGQPELGRYFAEVARLEAAAVRAFEVMIEELQGFGAPEELVLRARHARNDEIRHAWAFEELAESRGTGRLPVEVEPGRSRTLLEIALENAVEGVVRETWGALSATWQARHATDDAVRSVYESVAEDEAEHAELSHALDGWFATRLDEGERTIVEVAKRRALVELREELRSEEPDVNLVNVAGVPERARALDLLARLEADLFGTSDRIAQLAPPGLGVELGQTQLEIDPMRSGHRV
jgi:rubrerythrin